MTSLFSWSSRKVRSSGPIEVSDLQQSVGDGIHHECCSELAVDHTAVNRMDVPVQQHSWSQLPDEPVKRGEALLGLVAGAPPPHRWGVGDDDVDAAAGSPPQPCTRLQPQSPPAHLALGVLVGTLLVSEGSAETGDVQPRGLPHAALSAVTALGSGYRVAQ